MKSREELQREFAGDPAGLLEYTCQLQEQLSQRSSCWHIKSWCNASRSWPTGAVAGRGASLYRRTQAPTLWPQGRQA